MDSEEGKEKPSRNEQTPLYDFRGGMSFSQGVAMPFVSYFARRLGATAMQLGWLQALYNLFPNVLQIPWGIASDRVGRRVPLIVVGSSLAGVIFLFMSAAVTPDQILILVLFHAVSLSMIIPSWSALMGDVTSPATRGHVFSRFSIVGSVLNLLGTVIAGFIVLGASPTDPDIFRFLLALGAGGFIFAGLSIAVFRERGDVKKDAKDEPRKVDKSERGLHPRFKQFLAAQVFYTFFMSFIWGVMPITVLDVLGASNAEAILITIVSVATTIFFQLYVGRLMDRVGPRALVVLNRFLLVPVPLVYGLATSVHQLYFFAVLFAFPMAMFPIVFPGMILDYSPEKMRGRYFSIHGTAIGVCTFFGAVIGGYIATHFIAIWELRWALFVVYAISFVGRVVGAFLFLRVKEPRRYPESLKEVLERSSQQLRWPWRGH